MSENASPSLRPAVFPSIQLPANSRRDFLKGTGTVIAAGALAGAIVPRVHAANPRAREPPVRQQRLRLGCGITAARLGIRVS